MHLIVTVWPMPSLLSRCHSSPGQASWAGWDRSQSGAGKKVSPDADPRRRGQRNSWAQRSWGCMATTSSRSSERQCKAACTTRPYATPCRFTRPWRNSFHPRSGHSSRWTEDSSGVKIGWVIPAGLVWGTRLSSLTLTLSECVLTDHPTVVRSGVPRSAWAPADCACSRRQRGFRQSRIAMADLPQPRPRHAVQP